MIESGNIGFHLVSIYFHHCISILFLKLYVISAKKVFIYTKGKNR